MSINPYLSEHKAEGILSDLRWIEQNHASVDIFITDVFAEADQEGFWSFVYQYPEMAAMIVRDYFTENFDKWRNFFYNMLAGEKGETIIVIGDRGQGKDAVVQWICEVLNLAKKMNEGTFDIEEVQDDFTKRRELPHSWYNELTIKLAKWINRTRLPLFDHITWAGFYFEELPPYFEVVPSITEVPENSLTCLNEGVLWYSAKRGMRSIALEATAALATSRHRDQTLIIITQSTALLQIDFLRFCDCMIKKPMSSSHIALERKSNTPIANIMRPKSPMQTYIDYKGYHTLCTNPLPKNWSERMSKSMRRIQNEDEGRMEAVKLRIKRMRWEDIIITLSSRGFRRSIEWYENDKIIEDEVQKLQAKKEGRKDWRITLP